jgi:hypothetical protein
MTEITPATHPPMPCGKPDDEQYDQHTEGRVAAHQTG